MASTTGQNRSSPQGNREEELDDDGGGTLTETENSRLGSSFGQPEDSSCVHEVIYTSSLLPVNHYDAKTTEPISCGIQTLKGLLSWQQSKANPFNVATIPLSSREPTLAVCPQRTLVSHDMMGGYLEDRFAQGTESEAPYSFYHWQFIDIFNYFSHNMVTIPPAVWTNAAHKHGVIVLGTFITEWTEGATVCEAFLREEESYRTVADKLVQISHYYCFDGWLINIENIVSEGSAMNIPLFLRYLTEKMHERVPGSMVLWYDSVLEDGQLKWQNELNKTNRVFFDACDGIFTNYNWTEQSLERMRAYSGTNDRQPDIYVGVDVFARGEVVGGMFNTNKALELIRKHNFSVAIFAPAWVYESQDDKTKFRKNQDKFWALLSDFLHVHRLNLPLPFISSFCQGFGKVFYMRGQQEEKKSWFNLSAQELQPLYYTKQLEGKGWLRSYGCPNDAWNGGCSLMLEGMIPANLNKVCARIFAVHVPLASKTLVSLIYKVSTGITMSLELKTTDANLCTQKEVQEFRSTDISPLALSENNHLMGQFFQLCGPKNLNEWTIRCFQLELDGCALREVCVNIQREGQQLDTPFNCRIGEIMFLDAASLQVPSEKVESVCIYDLVWRRCANTSPGSSSPHLCLSVTLCWQYPTQLVRHFKLYYQLLRGPDPNMLPSQMVLLGRAYSTVFRVTELVIPKAPGLVQLVVQPVVKEGFLVPESHWGRCNLNYTEDHSIATEERNSNKSEQAMSTLIKAEQATSSLEH